MAVFNQLKITLEISKISLHLLFINGKRSDRIEVAWRQMTSSERCLSKTLVTNRRNHIVHILTTISTSAHFSLEDLIQTLEINLDSINANSGDLLSQKNSYKLLGSSIDKSELILQTKRSMRTREILSLKDTFGRNAFKDFWGLNEPKRLLNLYLFTIKTNES
ncbi:hypothetical protein BpHYR1_048535 [Brachionus plicatilis]|uniref:Uncharacterized protein n=1 Tax=Brachionus plicatilis TaxID=10195 RepID=A0A3M7QJP1_BRAPC|nr:hypothetical protein BpHYR1_048535 [Brachionus plicatilis]